ncbi:hypothetical protein B0H12DRAFT_1103565 [Mycena haematopus]|nr:hypothetical protein B0H12DRAFT_1103565 [Mycena haematopus]
MAEKLGLENLHEDLLLRILILTDIYTVLTISQVNTFFHAIASTKQLWLLLTRDLFLRGLIDIPSDEVNLSLSSDELRAQVKRAASGPRTWSLDSPTAPTLIQRFTVQLGDNRAHSTTLLPGGRYIIFQKENVDSLLECYNISTGRRVWSWTQPGFAVFQTDFSMASIDVRLLILRVDLESGHSREMLHFPSARVDRMGFTDPQSAEGYLGCILVPGNDILDSIRMPFLINQRTEQYIVFKCAITPTVLRIIPGYILLSTSRSAPVSVCVYSISSLERFWRSLSDFNLENATSESAITPAAIHVGGGVRLRSNSSYHDSQIDVFVTASLLRQNTYLLRVFDTVYGPLKCTRTASIYRLELSEFQTPQCTLLSTFVQSSAGTLVGVTAVSRAGYSVFSWARDGVRMLRQDDGAPIYIKFDGTFRTRRAILPHNGMRLGNFEGQLSLGLDLCDLSDVVVMENVGASR